MRQSPFDLGLGIGFIIQKDPRQEYTTKEDIIQAGEQISATFDFLRGMYGESINFVLDKIWKDYQRAREAVYNRQEVV